MAADKTDSWVFAEQYVPEDPVLLTARTRARELGCAVPSAGTGAALRTIAGALNARTAVEIGSSCGISALWLLEAMPRSGVLTIVDNESELLRAAREIIAEAGQNSGRVRFINSRPLDVLPRLADGGYDLAVCYAGDEDAIEHVDQAIRLLRPGGILAITSALWRDQVPDPARRDERTTRARVLGRQLRQDDRLMAAMLPTGDGLALALRRP